MRIGRACRGKIGLQCGDCGLTIVIIHSGQHHDIGVQPRQNGDDGGNLRIVTVANGLQQQARPVAGQFGVVGGDAQHLGPCRKTAQQQDQAAQQQDQTGASAPAPSPTSSLRRSAIMSATRPIAMPRMKRLAGRKAHAVIVQIRVCEDVS